MSTQQHDNLLIVDNTLQTSVTKLVTDEKKIYRINYDEMCDFDDIDEEPMRQYQQSI